MEKVPCVLADHLSEAQKKAYILADNRMAMDAGWDEELLRIEIESLQGEDFDVSLTGFREDEVTDLFAVREDPDDTGSNKEYDEGEFEMRNSRMNVQDAALNSTDHRFPWKWRLDDLKDVLKNGKTVFSCFSAAEALPWDISLPGTRCWGIVRLTRR